jgi:hypothetical protein
MFLIIRSLFLLLFCLLRFLQVIKHMTFLANSMGLKTSEKQQLALLIDSFWGDLLRIFDFQNEMLGVGGFVPLWQLDWWRVEVKDVTGLSTDTKCIWMTDAGTAVSMHKERVNLLCSLLQCSVGQLKALAITIMRPVWQVRMASNYKTILLSTYKLVRAEFITPRPEHGIEILTDAVKEVAGSDDDDDDDKTARKERHAELSNRQTQNIQGKLLRRSSAVGLSKHLSHEAYPNGTRVKVDKAGALIVIRACLFCFTPLVYRDRFKCAHQHGDDVQKAAGCSRCWD